jgi:predicted TIM-barrel fold metal-dependent hydrolase
MQAAGPRIIDAHFHLWDLDENSYPWLTDRSRPSLVHGREALRRNYRVADFLRDVGDLNVVAGVHIQAEHDPGDRVRETRWLQHVAAQPAARGFPQAIVADADFASRDVAHVLSQHASFPNVRGIRFALHRRLDGSPPYDPLLDPAWVGNFGLLAEHGLSFDLQLFPTQADAAVELIRRHGDVQFVLTHCAMPFLRDPENVSLWSRSLRAYAEHPNVAIKISGFGAFDPDWNARSIDAIVSEVVAAFGPSRCMLASNFPVEGLVKPYRAIWDTYHEYFAPYSEDERAMLFWRNAARIYRIAL